MQCSGNQESPAFRHGECQSAMEKLVDDCSDDIYSAGIDNDLVIFKDKEDRFLHGYGAFVAVPADR